MEEVRCQESKSSHGRVVNCHPAMYDDCCSVLDLKTKHRPAKILVEADRLVVVIVCSRMGYSKRKLTG